MLRRAAAKLAKHAFAQAEAATATFHHQGTATAPLPSSSSQFLPHLPSLSAALFSSAAVPAEAFSIPNSNRIIPDTPPTLPQPHPPLPPTSPPHRPSSHRLACVITPQPLQTQNLRVEATYVGSGINIYDLIARPEFSRHYKRLHKGTAIIALSDASVEEAEEAEGMPMLPYLVATTYGSAVFFNVEPAAKAEWLGVLQSVAADPALGEKKHNEEYIVTVAPELSSWSQLEPECIRLQRLDLRNMQVIAQVLAQSVALDYYSAHVERTIETFCSMNLEMAETASIAGVDKQVLLRLVAENNIVMTEIISKLGVHERYDIAWKYVQYGRIWEFLRAELEMEMRFKNLDNKMNLVQDNLKYFLEILQARKSDSLEWTIIILIAAEIALSLYELGSKVS